MNQSAHDVRRTVAMVGCGQMGSRLLQGLVRTKTHPLTIFVVDPDPASLKIAERRVIEAQDGQNHTVAFDTGYNRVDEKIDMAILASTSRYRFSSLTSLLEKTRPDTLLLEKFLFDRRDHYAMALSATAGISSFVHTPRGYWPAYRTIVERLAGRIPDRIEVSGTNFALASNCVHFFDLTRLFGLGVVDDVDVVGSLSPGKNRRAGFLEAYGELSGLVGGVPRVKVACNPGETARIAVTIHASDSVYQYTETAGALTITENGQAIAATAVPLMSSENTLVFENLMSDRSNALPTLAESSATHLAAFDALMPTLGTQDGALPVT